MKFRIPVKILKDRMVLFFLGISLYILLVICYKTQISPLYSYMGYNYKPFSFDIWFICSLISLFPLIFLPISINKPSDIASWFLYLFLFFPSSFVIPMVSKLDFLSSISFVLILMLMFYLFEFIRNFTRPLRIIKLPIRFNIYTFFLPVVTIIISLIIFSYSGFSLNFDINVYARRLASREVLVGGTGYLEAFLTTICIPLLFIYSLWKKNLYTLLIVFFAIVAVFALKGSKGVLFSPLFLGTLYILITYKKMSFGKIILVLFILLVSISLLEKIIFGTDLISILFIRRKIIGPPLLTTFYWEFFSENPFYYMKDSIIGPLIPFESNYTIPRARLIGFTFFNKIESNANANIWAASFADFGYIGMILTTIISAYTIKIFDILGQKRSFVICGVLCSYIAFVWTEGAFYTSILTNGLLFLLIFVWLGKASQN